MEEITLSSRLKDGVGTVNHHNEFSDRQDLSIITQNEASSTSDNDNMYRVLSSFERVLTSCNPILDSFLLQCPSTTILSLYQTSSYLRDFLAEYPLAWRSLSFKLSEANTVPTNTSLLLAAEDPRSKACDFLLQEVVVPFSLNLRSLELDNTGVSGDTLTTQVLVHRRSTLQHLSVRGCRNVSLKYSILPHIELYARRPTGFKSRNPLYNQPFALKSLYVYRCRHHRRRPYLGSSNDKTDSDSYATHQLVLVCRRLGIWTDTGWCTTPAGRCQRRRSYANSRLGAGPPEVWVPFDRLWRSRNRIGPVEGSVDDKATRACLWEKEEDGYDGEALGTGNTKGEGRMVPTHGRRSHRVFVEDIKCDNCNQDIPERCEQCSVLMHCAGCRQTLCYDCAFDKKYHIDDPVAYLPGELWWAPGFNQSPNLLKQPEYGGALQPPRLKMRWCCTEPMFSQGGGITFAVPAADARKCDRIRAAPVAKNRGWEDDEFSPQDIISGVASLDDGAPWSDYKQDCLIRNRLGDLSHKSPPCPRMFCESCYKSPAWRTECNACNRPLCNEHDLRGLRVRMCGYKDLTAEKNRLIQSPPIPKPASRIYTIIFQGTRGGGMAKVIDIKLSDEVWVEEMKGFLEFYKDPTNREAFVNIWQAKVGKCLRKMEEESIDPEDEDDDPICGVQGLFAPPAPPAPVKPVSSEINWAPPPPKWYGCKGMFCPQYRPVSDHRGRCAVVIKECSTCHVFVCSGCRKRNPPCRCSYCSTHYNCPNCHLELEDGVCRKAAEDEAERQKKMQLEKEKQERLQLNEAIGIVGEFFEWLHLETNPIQDDAAIEGATTQNELAIPAETSTSHNEDDQVNETIEDAPSQTDATTQPKHASSGLDDTAVDHAAEFIAHYEHVMPAVPAAEDPSVGSSLPPNITNTTILSAEAELMALLRGDIFSTAEKDPASSTEQVDTAPACTQESHAASTEHSHHSAGELSSNPADDRSSTHSTQGEEVGPIQGGDDLLQEDNTSTLGGDDMPTPIAGHTPLESATPVHMDASVIGLVGDVTDAPTDQEINPSSGSG